ncbi:MAG: sigma-70 family RNA polymerase sigma factor [Labilithrix sp.]|nr:sigma-70 family RNA polymerase sigma factor [Labilithrix sp.]
MTPITPFVPFAPAPAPQVVLARAAAQGDARAADRLMTALAPRVRRVVSAVLGAAHPELDDVVQQAMLGLMRALPSFRAECEPAHFASRIAARVAIASARRARAARARRDDEVEVDGLGSEPSEPVDRRRQELVRDLLARIPSEQAEALALRFVLGWSLGEVAEATGAPLNTVRSRLRLGRAALRAAILADPALADALV